MKQTPCWFIFFLLLELFILFAILKKKSYYQYKQPRYNPLNYQQIIN